MLLDNLQSWNRKCSPSNVHMENKVPQLRIQVRQISFKFYFYAVIYHHHHHHHPRRHHHHHHSFCVSSLLIVSLPSLTSL